MAFKIISSKESEPPTKRTKFEELQPFYDFTYEIYFNENNELVYKIRNTRKEPIRMTDELYEEIKNSKPKKIELYEDTFFYLPEFKKYYIYDEVWEEISEDFLTQVEFFEINSSKKWDLQFYNLPKLIYRPKEIIESELVRVTIHKIIPEFTKKTIENALIEIQSIKKQF